MQEKRIIKRIDKSSPYYERLSQEAVILKNVHHEGIPRLIDEEEDEDYLYLIEEYIEGATLRDAARASALSPRTVYEILCNISKIIEFLHKQNPPVYHLDLNPDNVMITPLGKVYIVDFGASLVDGRSPQSAMQFGMKGFAAPEMYEKGLAGPYSDIYSIGALAYFILTGKAYEEGMKLRAGKFKYGRLLKKTLNADFKRRPDIKRVIGMLNKGKRAKRSMKITPEVRTIGMLGLAEGNGTTYLSLLLAIMLAERTGKKIAYVEYNSSGDCSAMKDFQKEFPTNLTLIGDADQTKYTDVLNEDYDVVVTDFGTDIISSITDFVRCERKVLVGSNSPWKYKKEEIQFESLKVYFRYGSWRLITNLSEEKDKRVNRSIEGIIGYSMGFERLHSPSENAEQIFSKLISRR